MAEAERRIEEALRTGQKWLNLGTLDLDELPTRIGELRQLRGLALGGQALTQSGELEWTEGASASEFADLSPIAKLENLEVVSLSGCEHVADLSPLGSLSGLKSLGISYTSVTDLSPLASLTGLQNLDLSGCHGVTDLSPLAFLIGLHSLNITYTDVTDLSPLASLTGLQSLGISYTGVTDLSPLASLTSLQSLELNGCHGVTDLSPLASLTGLQDLDLSSIGVTDLSPLASLISLQDLDLSSTGVTDLSPLASLTGLQDLNLRSTGVTNLLPLASLTGLQDLDLSSTGVTDLSPMASVIGLWKLNLSSTGVTDLSPLASLTSLHILRLISTGVTDLLPLTSLTGLRNLDLSSSGGADLSPLASLIGLRYLDISGCMTAPESLLREVANLPKLQDLCCDRGENVPREVLSGWGTANCLERLRAHFADIAEASEAENEVKIILLGNGKVGKTQLCRRFRNLEPDELIESTHGVQLWREPLRLRISGEAETYQANWWDFGGQDIYHGTHALFLRSRAVFLILWTPALENQDEHEENGIPLRNQHLAYWLDYVRSLAGSESPVIVVQSQCDTYGQKRLLPALPDGFEFFQSTAYSAWTDLGRETLEGQIRDAIRYLREKAGALSIGKGRATVRRRLYEMRDEDRTREPEERQHRILSLDEFRVLCKQVGGVSSPELALDYFHQTGVVFHCSDLFSERIVLNQTWALDSVYAVFDRRRAAPYLRGSGRFTRKDLNTLVWSEHSEDEQRHFLGLMESCGICFQHGVDYKGETEYVAPDLLPPFAAVQRKLYAWRDDEPISTLRFSYRFFHQAIIRDLMSRVGQIAGEAAEYWKYGFWLYDRKRDSQVLVQQVDTYKAEAPGAGVLEIQAQGRDAVGLLREIRRLVSQDRIGEKPEQSLTIEGATVSRSELAHALGGQVQTTDGKIVSAAPFITFFEGRREDLAEFAQPERQERIKVDLAPAPAPEPDRRPEVFISYAWGDDSPEGIRRTPVVDRLQEELEKSGFAVQRDRDAQLPGDRISQFMKRLTEADRVVAVISEKYLHSFDCMYEIYRIYQGSRADGEGFARRVVPVVLPEVKLRRFEQRKPYLQFWSASAKELEASIRDPEIAPSKASWDEVRLVREFAQSVDEILCFVSDVLIPNNLDVLLGSDFEAVKATLLRRLKT